MGVKIGDNNTINNSTIAETVNNAKPKEEKKNWFEKHPLLAAILAAVVAGFILMFSFWTQIIQWLEGLF